MAVPTTGSKYSDGSPVPAPSYRCKSAVQVERAIKPSTYTHRCKIGIDHDGEHKCICGRSWGGKK